MTRQMRENNAKLETEDNYRLLYSKVSNEQQIISEVKLHKQITANYYQPTPTALDMHKPTYGMRLSKQFEKIINKGVS
jgi:hypothetical protein